jgi:DDE superfamily endonuclease/Helix-turn-helix of DDE superfamily endonuclease
MILRYRHLSRFPRVFKAMTGVDVLEFDTLLRDVLPRYATAEHTRLSRPDRKRAPGAGHPFTLDTRDQLLLIVVWLRLYPLHEVLAYLFAISDSTVSRSIARMLPLLEASGRDTMRMPDPGKKRRRNLDALLSDTPELAIVIDTFEQRVQRPRERADADGFYSGKKRQHTLKSQVAVDEESGRIVDIADSAPGPTGDIKVLEDSGLLPRLPAGVGAIGDLAYVGIDKVHPDRLGASPRRKPRAKDRPAEDIAYNRAFSRRRIVVEHSIGWMRRYQSLSQTDRNHRQNHSARVRAVAGLVNRRIDRHCPR